MQDKNTHEGIDKYIKLQSIVAHSPDPLKIINKASPNGKFPTR